MDVSQRCSVAISRLLNGTLQVSHENYRRELLVHHVELRSVCGPCVRRPLAHTHKKITQLDPLRVDIVFSSFFRIKYHHGSVPYNVCIAHYLFKLMVLYALGTLLHSILMLRGEYFFESGL